MSAIPADPTHPDSLHITTIAQWLTIATDRDGAEHVVLSDGWHHIRLDIEEGKFSGSDAVLLTYRLTGLGSAGTRILPLRRFLDLCRRRRFGPTLYPRDPRVARWIDLLRVHDALVAGATQREIGTALYGAERIVREWNGSSDSLRSRVRRLARDASAMAAGGYRYLLQPRS